MAVERYTDLLTEPRFDVAICLERDRGSKAYYDLLFPLLMQVATTVVFHSIAPKSDSNLMRHSGADEVLKVHAYSPTVPISVIPDRAVMGGLFRERSAAALLFCCPNAERSALDPVRTVASSRAASQVKILQEALAVEVRELQQPRSQDER